MSSISNGEPTGGTMLPNNFLKMASQALGRGVGLADIQKILGHSKVETTMKYIHADFDRMKKAVEILEEMSIMNKAKDAEKPIAQN